MKWARTTGLSLSMRVLRNRILLLFLSLSLLGYVVGKSPFSNPTGPYDQLVDDLKVFSYRDTPSDTIFHFVAELNACGRPFAQLDVDSRRFSKPEHGSHYVRAISGTHYPPLRLRGHADQGFWLELPDSLSPARGSGQFDELYQKSLGYVKPLAIAANVLGVLSGYSIGYRIATWDESLCNPRIQQRLLSTPGIERQVALEAWRRVLLEPALIGDVANTDAFSAIHEKQRVYANFYRLALRDTNGFIPREVERLAEAGAGEYSRAMRSYARAVRRATQDTCMLGSKDFRAIEEWAGMLFGRGHWASYAAPPQGEGRSMYLGALTYYGLGPASPQQTRIWVGPRMLVKVADVEGYVSDDIPTTALGCPSPWRTRLMAEASARGETWPAEWAALGNMVDSRLMPAWREFEKTLPHAPARPTDARPAAARPPDPPPAQATP